MIDDDFARPRVTGVWGPLDGQRRGLLIAGVAFQIVFLLGMVATFARPHNDPGSRVVLLRVVPVDPRDLLRGQYVILSYDASRPPGAAGEVGGTVYVTLAVEPDGRHYRAVDVVDERPGDGRLFLPGTRDGSGRVRYGIESYYVQEGRGKAFEEAARAGSLSAEVVVAPDGTPALRNLVVDAEAAGPVTKR